MGSKAGQEGFRKTKKEKWRRVGIAAQLSVITEVAVDRIGLQYDGECTNSVQKEYCTVADQQYDERVKAENFKSGLSEHVM